MAKVIVNKNGTSPVFTIAGLTSKEFCTLYAIIKDEALIAADKDDKKYTDKGAEEIIALKNAIENGYRNKVEL